MKRKTFKVMTRKNFNQYVIEATLKEVKGYFKNLETETIFIYYNEEDHKWYVVDVFTGLAITHSNNTMKEAKKEFIETISFYREFKKTQKYNEYILKYQNLLKERR